MNGNGGAGVMAFVSGPSKRGVRRGMSLYLNLEAVSGEGHNCASSNWSLGDAEMRIYASFLWVSIRSTAAGNRDLSAPYRYRALARGAPERLGSHRGVHTQEQSELARQRRFTSRIHSGPLKIRYSCHYGKVIK